MPSAWRQQFKQASPARRRDVLDRILANRAGRDGEELHRGAEARTPGKRAQPAHAGCCRAAPTRMSTNGCTCNNRHSGAPGSSRLKTDLDPCRRRLTPPLQRLRAAPPAATLRGGVLAAAALGQRRLSRTCRQRRAPVAQLRAPSGASLGVRPPPLENSTSGCTAQRAGSRGGAGLPFASRCSRTWFQADWILARSSTVSSAGVFADLFGRVPMLTDPTCADCVRAWRRRIRRWALAGSRGSWPRRIPSASRACAAGIELGGRAESTRCSAATPAMGLLCARATGAARPTA